MLSYEHSACKKPRYSIYKNINSPKCGQGGDLDLQWNLFVHPFSSDILRAKEDKTAERMMRFIPSNNLYVAHQLEPCCLGQPLRSPRAPCSLSLLLLHSGSSGTTSCSSAGLAMVHTRVHSPHMGLLLLQAAEFEIRVEVPLPILPA